MNKLEWERFAVIGTTSGKLQDKDGPRLLAANCLTLEQAAAQCKRYSEQGWGCQVMPVIVRAVPPMIEQGDTPGTGGAG